MHACGGRHGVMNATVPLRNRPLLLSLSTHGPSAWCGRAHPAVAATRRRLGSLAAAVSMAAAAATPTPTPTDACAGAATTAGTVVAHGVSLLNQADSIAVDVDLMQEPGFSIDQLMELAGLSCACAIARVAPPAARVLIVCGPGNNGGDGLVAARHLHHFGYTPVVVYPKRPGKPLFANLVAQQEQLGIEVLFELPAAEALTHDYALLVDAIFGFSFKRGSGIRAPFDSILPALASSPTPLLSIDVPSGWDVEQGPPEAAEDALNPQVLVSLTAPKLCARFFTGRHFLGGRFVPPFIVERYNLTLPSYSGTEQIVELPWAH